MSPLCFLSVDNSADPSLTPTAAAALHGPQENNNDLEQCSVTLFLEANR
jgi:hypothetical protein